MVNKFDDLKIIVKNKVDILILTETKLNESFPTAQFNIDRFISPYRRDRNRNGGGVLIYVREDIPSKELRKHTFPDVIFDKDNSNGAIECIFIEINLRKCKWLIFGTYHRPSQNNEYYFDKITNALDIYIKTYDRFLLIGDFNTQDHEQCIASFLNQYDSRNLVKEPTCFKNPENPSCIDLFITNQPMSFQNTGVLNIGCSDFHKMTITVMKTKFNKSKPKEITYRNYKHFNENYFKNELKQCLGATNIKYIEFEEIFLNVLEKFAPIKKKIIRGNHAPYMNKILRKATMRRTQLQNIYYKSKSNEDLVTFKKQRNFVSRLYKKQKKKYFKSTLQISLIIENSGKT